VRRGLVTGAFAPLHRGHQLLIETALASVDDLVVVVYDCRREGMERMPAAKRARWVTDLYPELEAVVVLPDPYDGDPFAATAAAAPAYAEEVVRQLGRFDRFFSSEPAYEAFAHLVGAKHVLVDQHRLLVPVSGTQFRECPFEYRGLVDPSVYKSLIERVVFVGTESTGKTTLAKLLGDLCGTTWVHEYGRELWEAQDLKGSLTDHLKMAERQERRVENAAAHADSYVFADTNAWTTLQWCLRTHGTADPRLHALAEANLDKYTWFLCADDFGWVQDGTRELEGDLAHNFQLQQFEDLNRRGISFTYLRGSIEQRKARVLTKLGDLALERSRAA
jgi:NadR type nicotinamide-nucleotide adenylyltransferase